MKKYIWYVEAEIRLPVTLQILAETEEEVVKRTKEGAWHGILRYDSDHAETLSVGKFVKGPGYNG